LIVIVIVIVIGRLLMCADTNCRPPFQKIKSLNWFQSTCAWTGERLVYNFYLSNMSIVVGRLTERV